VSQFKLKKKNYQVVVIFKIGWAFMSFHPKSKPSSHFLSGLGVIIFWVGLSIKLSFLTLLLENQTMEKRIFFNLSLLPLYFLIVSLKPNIALILYIYYI